MSAIRGLHSYQKGAAWWGQRGASKLTLALFLLVLIRYEESTGRDDAMVDSKVGLVCDLDVDSEVGLVCHSVI